MFIAPANLKYYFDKNAIGFGQGSSTMTGIFLPIYFSLIAGFVSWGLTKIFLMWVPRLNIQDIPNERSSHRFPTPRGGGLGAVVSLLTLATVFSATHCFD